MDRLQSMDVFVRVAERGGFTPVARELGISATMVGKHIFFLEERLGTRLINRTTRRQSLTEAGATYLERCIQVLAAVAEAESGVMNLRRTARGVLRVSSPVTFGSQCLAPALADYLAQNPEVSVELTLNDRSVDLVEEGFEATIHIGKLEDSSLIAHPLRPYRSQLCASPAYLAQHGTPKKPADLATHNCLGFMYWDRRGWWRLIGKKGESLVRVRGNFTVNHGPALRAAALAGLGIVMQPDVLFADDLESGRLVRVLEGFHPPERPMNLLTLPDRHPTPRLRSFIDFMIGRFGAKRR